MEPTGDVTRQIQREMQAGKREAFDRFFERSAARLLVYIQYNIGDRLRRKIEPADILQNIYLRLYEHFDTFSRQAEEHGVRRALVRMADHEITEAYRYHFKVAKRDARREITAAWRDPEGLDTTPPADAIPAGATSITQRIVRDEEYRRVMEMLRELTPIEQYVTVSKIIEEASTDEIADRLGKTRGAVQMIFLRVRNKLRDRLSREAGDSTG